MTKAQYIRIMQPIRKFYTRYSWAKVLLFAPTALFVLGYMALLLSLLVRRDQRLLACTLVPLAVFVATSVIRRIINRPRPYDTLDFEPIGDVKRGKGQSLPSRHTASAVAIACAFVYVYPLPVWVMLWALLVLIICTLRVATGKHYPSDVLVAVIFSVLLSIIGFALI